MFAADREHRDGTEQFAQAPKRREIERQHRAVGQRRKLRENPRGRPVVAVSQKDHARALCLELFGNRYRFALAFLETIADIDDDLRLSRTARARMSINLVSPERHLIPIAISRSRPASSVNAVNV